MKKIIFLIGARASGKSKTSRRIYKSLSFSMLSTDTLIYYEEGKDIATLIAEKGWPYFRKRETEVLKKCCKLENYVIDCGGGILVELDSNGNEIFSKKKANLLKKHGYVIYLKADLKWLYQKIKDDVTRPNLSKKNSFVSLMKTREKHYSKVADYIIDSTKCKGSEIAEKVLRHLKKVGYEIIES